MSTTARQADTRWLPALLVANLVCQVGIVVTGGLVRVTGSGLGCPTWPQCVPGSYVPTVEQEEGFHKIIEFGNRTLTGVLSVVALALLWALWRYARHRRDLILGTVGVLVGIAAQAIVGGISVRTGLNPWIVGFHFTASMVLVAISAWLVWRARQPAGPTNSLLHPFVSRASWAVVAVLGVVLVLGTVVTGSGPHSGDAETPARTGFDPRTISWLHADAVMLLVGLVVAVWIGARIASRSEIPGRAWGVVLAVTLAQGLVGYTQYLTNLPEVLVVTHMLMAALLVVAVTRAMVLSRTPSPRTPESRTAESGVR
ncbi:COX15/CtaA family protein [Marihabitans asiaticum]|uniref:Cytochrome c oxidase assembly protein subunit 15 n=1 Tax=Marihabitans asiaticum TaxID=415218 RepID=A0A560WAU8_9MICO|nr:COX15/CtaA family protein [Marihabitans asiaticum]TWD14777.1 cytochrome c oxidase assembly protein subunit 15 [Marihabitans asiaticum]